MKLLRKRADLDELITSGHVINIGKINWNGNIHSLQEHEMDSPIYNLQIPPNNFGLIIYLISYKSYSFNLKMLKVWCLILVEYRNISSLVIYKYQLKKMYLYIFIYQLWKIIV